MNGLSVFLKNDPTPDTHESRLNAAAATVESALTIFSDVLIDLDNAHTDYVALALDAEVDAKAAAEVATTARLRAHDALVKADRIRELVGQ